MSIMEEKIIRPLRNILVLPLLCQASCTGNREPSLFRVSVDEPAIGATLRLCSSNTQMISNGHGFGVSKRVDCEGSGDIVVKFRDGMDVACPIGYVTYDAPMYWSFAVTQRKCAYAKDNGLRSPSR